MLQSQYTNVYVYSQSNDIKLIPASENPTCVVRVGLFFYGCLLMRWDEGHFMRDIFCWNYP